MYMGIDQYGNYYHGLVHPRKDLAGRIGGRVEKMWCDLPGGGVRHTGYVVGKHWVELFVVTPINA